MKFFPITVVAAFIMIAVTAGCAAPSGPEDLSNNSAITAGEQQLAALPDADDSTDAVAGYAGISAAGRAAAFQEVAALARCSFGDSDPTIGATTPAAGWHVGGWGGGARQALVVNDQWAWYVFEGRQSRECNRVAYRLTDDGTLRLLSGNHILYQRTEPDVYRSEWIRTFGSGAVNGQVRRVE